MSEHFLPTKAGAEKKPVRSASSKDLEFWAKRLTEKLTAEPTGDYAEKNRVLLAAIQAEQASRVSQSNSSSSAVDRSSTTTHRVGELVIEIRVRSVREGE